MAKEKLDFKNFITEKEEVATINTNVSSSFDIENFDNEKSNSKIEKSAENDLSNFLSKAKFLKAFENLSFDRKTVKINIPLIADNNNALEKLASILSDDYGFSKTELLNLIVASFFEKNKKEIGEAYKQFLLKETNFFE